MYYILKSDQTYNKMPEISYVPGVTIQFKKGFFLFDTEATSDRYFETENHLQINGIKHKIYGKIENTIKAEVRYLQLKIEELKNNSYYFFMPNSFKIYTDRFEQIQNSHPEYII